MTYHRRENYSVGLANWPACNATDWDNPSGFYNSGEGGTELWLIVPKTWRQDDEAGGVRDVCITGFDIGVLWWNAFCEPLATMIKTVNPFNHRKILRFTPLSLDGAICIGASSLCPWDCERQEMWVPTFADLTDEGKTLYKTVKDLYNCEPVLSLVLDT